MKSAEVQDAEEAGSWKLGATKKKQERERERKSERIQCRVWMSEAYRQ